MVSSSSSDDISGLGTQGVGAFRGGAGSGWGGVGGRPALSPSLDLQFATDKTLTARRGPTPTFTRASAATYYGPLVNYNSVTGFSTTGISNGRASWFKSEGGEDITISYNGTRWQVVAISGENTFEYLAAVGSEWRPDQANWTGSGGFPVTTSSNYGVVRAGTNEPRFDHDPITLACKGLLIEESRTNLLLQNQTFNTTWTSANLNTTGTPAYVNVATSPDGNTTADKIIATAVLSTHQFRQSATLVSGTTYSLTCYFKAAEQQFASIQVFGVANGSNDWISVFNISSTPSTGTFNGFTSTSVTSAGNGWIRCTVVFTTTASGSLEIRLGGASGTSGINPHIYLGDGTSGILVWGAQLEAGAFPTSYIPTTTASVVRSADICSITGANFTSFYNQSEGTVYTESRPATVNGTTTTFSLSNGTANERWLNRFAQNEQVVITSAGVEANLDALNPVAGTLYKVATAAKLNDIAMSINGLAVVTDTSQPMPNADRAGLGNSTGTNTAGAVTIASIRYYKKRLPNAKLQTLTA